MCCLLFTFCCLLVDSLLVDCCLLTYTQSGNNIIAASPINGGSLQGVNALRLSTPQQRAEIVCLVGVDIVVVLALVVVVVVVVVVRGGAENLSRAS